MTMQIKELLQRRIGMDIRSVGEQSLQRVLKGELKKFGCNLTDYKQRLPDSAIMWTSLVEAVVVPETWFFRYPESFKLLAELTSHLLKRQATNQLSILCLPCSTGEEPYSVAISLIQQGFATDQFSIDAMDINSKVLEQAQQGLFRDYSFRGCPQELKQQFFSANDGGYQIHPQIAATVRFSYGNLLDPGSLPTKKYHLIFCRNLLIYFDKNTQTRAIGQLRQLLWPDGYLFAGPAETSAFASAGMTSLAQRDSFCFSNPPVKPQALPNRHKPQPQAAKTNSAKAIKTTSVAVQRPLLRSRNAHSTAKEEVHQRVNNLLQDIERLADQGQLQHALELCQQALQQLGPSAQLFYLWGLLSDSLNQKGNAEMYYRKTLYIEPLHAQALTQLVALLRAQNDHAAAERFEQRLHSRT